MIYISPSVHTKIENKHGLNIGEVHEAIASRTGKYLKDMREEHKSDPPTLWFIGESHAGKKIKIAFIFKDGVFIIRTAYIANSEELRIYAKYSL